MVYLNCCNRCNECARDEGACWKVGLCTYPHLYIRQVLYLDLVAVFSVDIKEILIMPLVKGRVREPESFRKYFEVD